MDLESVKVTTAGRRRLLRVVVDSDRGVSLDDAALASRELSAKLDASDVMGDMPYTLEVSSPGVDRPLTQPRHWQRAVGRLVRVPLTPSGAGHARTPAAPGKSAPGGRPSRAGWWPPTRPRSPWTSTESTGGSATPPSVPGPFRSNSAGRGSRPRRTRRTGGGLNHGDREGSPMDIDLSALRMLESEKDISMDTSVKAIEDALLVAYHRTEGAAQAARVQVDRKTGHVTVWATEAAPDGAAAASTTTRRTDSAGSPPPRRAR